MDKNREWLKFIISGKIEAYVNYKNECKKQQICGGVQNTYFDRWPCDKGNTLR